MTEDELDNLLTHPLLPPVWIATRLASHHFAGIPEVKAMETLKTPDQLRQEWSNMGMYEGGLDWEAPEPPSGAEGLTVVELKDQARTKD